MRFRPVVTLKGIGDGIAVDIHRTADFDTVTQVLREKVSGSKKFFAGASAVVQFRGRSLSPKEEETLLLIISQEAGVAACKMQAVPTAKTQKNNPVSPADKTVQAPPPPEKKGPMEGNCAFFRNGLRSGQTIKYNGSVVIMGDVNAGSEVVADGNVIVMGSLKGMAHAGAAGDYSCFVSANIMQPVQLRIADVISSMPAGKRRPEVKPSFAYIKDGKLFIAAL